MENTGRGLLRSNGSLFNECSTPPGQCQPKHEIRMLNEAEAKHPHSNLLSTCLPVFRRSPMALLPRLRIALRSQEPLPEDKASFEASDRWTNGGAGGTRILFHPAVYVLPGVVCEGLVVPPNTLRLEVMSAPGVHYYSGISIATCGPRRRLGLMKLVYYYYCYTHTHTHTVHTERDTLGRARANEKEQFKIARPPSPGRREGQSSSLRVYVCYTACFWASLT